MLRGNKIFRVTITVGILIIIFFIPQSTIADTISVNNPREYWAVLAAISDYNGVPLPYSINEVNNFKGTLLAGGNWDRDHIKMVLGSNATKNGIYDALNWLADNADDNDISIFYFVGHGGRNLTNEYIMAYDRSIYDLELSQYISNIPGVVVVIIDTCYSGGFIKELRGFNRIILTACQKDEVTYQVRELKSGIFGYFLNMSLGRFTKTAESSFILTKFFSIYYSAMLGNNSEYIVHPMFYDGTLGLTKIVSHHTYNSFSFPFMGSKLWRVDI